MNMEQLEKRIEKLEHNQREIVSELKKAGILKFVKPGSPYEPRPILNKE